MKVVLSEEETEFPALGFIFSRLAQTELAQTEHKTILELLRKFPPKFMADLDFGRWVLFSTILYTVLGGGGDDAVIIVTCWMLGPVS